MVIPISINIEMKRIQLPKNKLARHLFAPWHLALDATLLIGFLSWVYFFRRNKAGS